MYTRKYLLAGTAFGILFPIMGSIILALTGTGLEAGSAGLTPENLLAVQKEPILWIIWSAPIFLGGLAAYTGARIEDLVRSEAQKREEYLHTARTLVAAARSLLSTVSAFSSTTAETAASVRETTATMGQLGHTATQAALTAETVIGLAQQGAKISAEGLAAVDASQAEMTKLADEVRALSQRIEGLNGRMRDIFEIASVVNYIADRSQRLADRAAQEAARAGAAGIGFADVVAEMRHHAEDAKRAAAQVKGILSEVHKAMLASMTAAEVGIKRAEQGANVAAGTGEIIRRLATALQESSGAAREIATVAQQQDHGIDEVLKAMNEIYLATQDTMTSTQAVAAEARALNDLANAMKQTVE
jgi:methyl-accepting chemotaxis protein